MVNCEQEANEVRYGRCSKSATRSRYRYEEEERCRVSKGTVGTRRMTKAINK